MAPIDGRGDIKPAPDFALCEAMHILREVVREPPALVRLRVVRRVWAVHQRRAGDDAKAQQEGTHERGDERGGGAHAGLVHLANRDAGGQESGELVERGSRRREGTRFELFPLRIEIVVPHNRDVEARRAQQGPHALWCDGFEYELQGPLQREMHKLV